MTLEPLLRAPLAVQLHVATIVPAWLVGTWVMFFSRRGSRVHRIGGIVFLALLAVTSVIALFIHRVTPNFYGFSTVHLTIPWTLMLIWLALDGAWHGKFMQHKVAVVGLYGGSLTITAIVNVFTAHHIIRALFFAN